MPRPRKKRKCRHHAGDRVFKPRSIPLPNLHVLPLREDELEALRLCDLEGFDQTEAGERMGVSRGTVQRLLKNGRSTLVRAIVENSALLIVPETRENEEDVDATVRAFRDGRLGQLTSEGACHGHGHSQGSPSFMGGRAHEAR